MLQNKNKQIIAIISFIVVSAFIVENTHATIYSSSISNSGSITVDVSTIKGASLGKDTLVINSTCPSGYELTISGPTDATLYKDGDSSATSTITASAGTLSSPSPILGTGYLNTWGYSIAPDTTINSATFVGLTNSPATILSKNQASATGGDSLNVYYGVSVDSTKEPGTYKMKDDGTITYYLTTSLDCTSYQVAFNPTSTASGSSLSGTGTMSNQRISENTATPLATNGFTAPAGYYFGSWNTNQDGTGTAYANGDSVTDLTTVGQTITLYAQWVECESGHICYKANGANVEGTMGRQVVAATDTSITPLASNFSRTGYGFAGWSDVPDYASNQNAHFYGPQEDITFAAGEYNGIAGGLILYAVWIQSAGSLQADAASVCESLIPAPTDGTANLSSVSALTDQRDNNTYAIARLADGKCWMIENLRLDNSAALTLANTNNPLNDGTNVTLKHNYTDTETHNTLSASHDPTAAAWCTTNAASCDDQSMLYTGNTANRASYETDSTMTNSANIYSYGNYYNWYSATAGRGTYSFGTNNDSVAGDLCPAGWHLPKGGDKSNEANNEFWSLIVTGINNGINPANYESGTRPYYSGTDEAGSVDTKLRSYPNNFIYSGNVNSGSLVNRGSYGYFWSSTAYSSYGVYNLYLDSSSVYPSTSYGGKYGGATVRCVANYPPEQVTTPGHIGYYANVSDAEGTMGEQAASDGDTVTLLASNFSRTGYGFAGWSDVPDYTYNQNAHFYGPQEDITVPTGTSTDGLSLYAVWVKSQGSIQDTTKVSNVCSSLTPAPTNGTANLSSVSAFTDSRDNETYAIARLADGKCWMIENLRLESGDTVGQNRFDSSITNESLAQGYGKSTTYGNFIGLANPETEDFTASDKANSIYYSGTQSGTASVDIGSNSSSYPNYRFPRYNNMNTPTSSSDRPQYPTTNSSTNGTSKAGMYSYGNYYTWSAAMANNIYYDSPTTQDADGKTSETVNTSLCPTGWRLPYGRENGNGAAPGGFSNLDIALGGTGTSSSNTAISQKWRSYPNNFLYNGFRYTNDTGSRGSQGYYWTSTAKSGTSSHNLFLSDSYVRPGTGDYYKPYAHGVRCVASF